MTTIPRSFRTRRAGSVRPRRVRVLTGGALSLALLVPAGAGLITGPVLGFVAVMAGQVALGWALTAPRAPTHHAPRQPARDPRALSVEATRRALAESGLDDGDRPADHALRHLARRLSLPLHATAPDRRAA